MTSPVPSLLKTIGTISSTYIMLSSDLLEPLSSVTNKPEVMSSTSSLHSSMLSTYTSITDTSIIQVASSSTFTMSSQGNIICVMKICFTFYVVIENTSTVMTTSAFPTPSPKGNQCLNN